MNTRVHSFVQTPSQLCADDVSLIIPSYQRPYVWPSEDVTALLDQIIAAYEAGAPHYYIGTILTSVVAIPSSKGSRTTYEVIDGQQRMTTLMLLALALNTVVPGNPLAAFVIVETRPRLVFAIREEVQRLLGSWAGLEVDAAPRGSTKTEKAYFEHLVAARKALSDRLSVLQGVQGEGSERFLSGLAAYIFARVKWVNNVMPRGMDLNRLFSTMNNSGVQLEQSDILKSRLLRKIEKNKSRYDAIWQACENMDDYFERNLRRVFPGASWKTLKADDLAKHNATFFPLDHAAPQAEMGMTIAQIAKLERQESAEVKNPTKPIRYCRPIVSFSLLLMHTYRIYLHQWEEDDVEIRLNDSRLNEYFEDFVTYLDERQAKKFIECLWQVRFQFDRWVVKWLPEQDSTNWHLRLTSLLRGKTKEGYRLVRSSLESSELSQLQSVRNFTGERSAQYWLTPFLGALIAGKASSIGQVQMLLEQIDNQLSLSEDSQKLASFKLLSETYPAMRSITAVLAELKVPQGTRFEHYWFQKLEYILWRERSRFNFYDLKKLAAYRVTSKNSVEHVHPRKEEFGQRLDSKHLDSFGNLVLLSPGENSSYSNQSVGKKREHFREKDRYDSLKLAHMFNAKANREWDGAAIEQHQEQMLRLIASHYGQ